MDSDYPQEELDQDAKEYVENISSFMVNMSNESDRSAVIIGAARLDIALERLLKRVMHNHPGGNDNLFDQDRPLSTFSAKIAIAYRLGLVDASVEHAMQMVRKVRNDFAHSIENAKLSDGPIRNRVNEMVRQCSHYHKWPSLRALYGQGASTAPLADFCTALNILIILVETGTELAHPLAVPFTLGTATIGEHPDTT